MRDAPSPAPKETESATDPSQWVEQHGDALFRYAMLHLGNRETAEDRVQETFVAALKARHTFEGRSSERTWLIGILRRKIFDTYRARRRTERNESDVASTVSGTFTDDGHWHLEPRTWPEATEGTPREELRRALVDCLGRLDERLREAVCLREFHDLETTTICDILDLSATNLSTRLHRARLALRECMELNWLGPRDPGG